MKKGITVAMLVVIVTMMLIATTTVSVVGVNSINRANFETYKNKINKISDLALEYVTTNNSLPVTNEVVGKVSLDSDFIKELNSNGDADNNMLVIDLSKLDATVDIGNGTVVNGDVFVICENTNNVYYLKGMEYKGVVYHSDK